MAKRSKKSHLTYTPVDGYVNDWLVLGPASTPITQPPAKQQSGAQFCAATLKAVDHVTADFAQAPLEVERHTIGKDDFYWDVLHCRADHVLEYTCAAPLPTHHRLWAFVRFVCPDQKRATLHISTTCDMSVWVNGRFARHQAHSAPAAQTFESAAFGVNLKPGNNDVLVRLDQVAAGASLLACTVRFADVPLDALRILLPTVTQEPERRQEWEQAFAYTRVSRGVYGRDDDVALLCEADMPSWRQGVMRMQDARDNIYAETFAEFKAEQTIQSVSAVQLPSGQMQAVLMAHPSAYYEMGFRPRRSVPFWIANYRYATQPVAARDDLLVELMQEAQRSNDVVYAELAKMSLGWWTTIESAALKKEIARIRLGGDNALPDLLGLARMRLAMARYDEFPKDLAPEIDACLLEFDYGGGSLSSIDLNRPDNQILLIAGRLLAGQAYMKETFAAAERSGRLERKQGEEDAVAWLRQHAQHGFGLWNLQSDLIIAALATLVDLAKSEAVQDLAAVMLDKLVFSLAFGSFKGSFAQPRQATLAAVAMSGRFAPETALNRLLWGMGGYNMHFKAAVSLALASRSYEPPALIHAIALDQTHEIWSRERSLGPDGEVNHVTYKTPDFMLASAQDYRPGQPGWSELIWQATMSPDAQVFVTMPGAYSLADGRRAGWWCGNASLPRVAQWRDTIIALYQAPEQAGLGFTHAYFPAFAFDEHSIEQGWAFARKDNAYLALRASPEAEFIELGDDAQRELRSLGSQTVWLCQMGRADVDGSFEEFRARVLAQQPAVDGLRVDWTTIRGERLGFAWTGALTVNGEETPITDFGQVESPFAVAAYPAETMDIVYGEDVMRLHFA